MPGITCKEMKKIVLQADLIWKSMVLHTVVT